jgi:phage gp36-like protein
MIKIIDENKPCEVVICTYNLGKEELLQELAKHYQTKVVLNESRMRDTVALGIDSSMFTIDHE